MQGSLNMAEARKLKLLYYTPEARRNTELSAEDSLAGTGLFNKVHKDKNHKNKAMRICDYSATISRDGVVQRCFFRLPH